MPFEWHHERRFHTPKTKMIMMTMITIIMKKPNINLQLRARSNKFTSDALILGDDRIEVVVPRLPPREHARP